MLIHIIIIEVSAAPVCVLCACVCIHREYRKGERRSLEPDRRHTFIFYLNITMEDRMPKMCVFVGVQDTKAGKAS